MADAPRPPMAPPTLDRSAVERVLARAAELQGSGPNETEGRLSEAQLEALAKEVGLDPINLRQALAEERTRSPFAPSGAAPASWYGVASVSAQRTVYGTPAQVLKALDDWMQRQEGLVPQRYFGDRIVWESGAHFVAAVRRAVSGRGHALGKTTSVAATAVAVDAQRVLVRLDADLTGHRSSMVTQAVGMSSTGVVLGGVLAVLGFMPALIAVPFVLLAPGSVVIGRTAHAKATERAQLALEQVLDRLERGEAGRPPSLIGMLAAAVGGRKI